MNIKKSALTLSLSGAIAFGICVGVKAADTLETISAYLNYGITVKYNGDVQELKDANGKTVYPITYEGTTYLPVRAISNILGIEVNWDGATKTVWLGEGFEPTPAATSTSSTGQTVDGQQIQKFEFNPDTYGEVQAQGGYYVTEAKPVTEEQEAELRRKDAEAINTGIIPIGDGYSIVTIP